MNARAFVVWPHWLWVLLLFSRLAVAADAPAVPTAPVIVDGVTLFRVRGVAAFPAEERAQAITRRILEIARDPRVATSTLRVVPGERSSDIVMGDRPILSVFDADAEMDGIHRVELARVYVHRIGTAIEAYRHDRSPRTLAVGAAASLAATAGLVIAVWAVLRLWRRLTVVLERRYARRLRGLGVQSVQLVHAERIRAAAQAILRALRSILLLVLVYLYLSFVLTRFPWTRPTAARLLGYVVTPFEVIGSALIGFLPNLIFLAVLILVTRYALKVLSIIAAGVDRGAITFRGFEPEWAFPTYRILRIAAIGLAAVVAYPYIPGSESAAFKGLSIFFGLVLSLGASSAVANILAGYSLIYRRAFKVGDRVKINDVVGDVASMHLQVTHLRTIKNEDVIVPNSVILTSQVVNYSSFAGEGLILHTTVGIGYEVPWRQVEAMLLMAASRTPGLLTTPPPFVLQRSLADFAVNYELNAYCRDAHAMISLYSELHRSIQDVFNEYGVQIMTPAYEMDPQTPKIVPKDQWYQAPARRREEPPGNAAG